MMLKKLSRTTAWVLLLAMALTLSACGKSEAARAVEDQIAAIGTVTLDSEAKIAAAERALAALEEKDSKQVSNKAVLTQARADLDALAAAEEQKKLAEEQRRHLEAKAAEVDAVIAAIGEVTLDSGSAIALAREAYEASDEEVQALVTGLAVLEAAEAGIMELRAEEVAKLIDGIGKVTLESGPKIQAAQEAMAGLTAGEAAKVRNAEALKAAVTELAALKRQKAEALLANCRCEDDPVRNLRFYYPMALPYYADLGYWGADVRCFVLPYLGVQGSNVWLRLICNYTASDWVFFKKITFAVDDARYYKTFRYNDVVRDNAYGDVWEYADIEVGSSDIAMLTAIANSRQTIIRFEGDNYYHDFTVSQKDKEAIRQMLDIYNGLK